jgi:hypothetical protein
MGILFIDQVQITPVTIDSETGAETEAALVTSVANIEFEDRISYGSDGQPIRPVNLILLPADTVIKYGDYITPTKIRKITASAEEGKQRRVVSVFPVAGLSKNSHLEIKVSSASGN